MYLGMLVQTLQVLYIYIHIYTQTSRLISPAGFLSIAQSEIQKKKKKKSHNLVECVKIRRQCSGEDTPVELNCVDCVLRKKKNPPLTKAVPQLFSHPSVSTQTHRTEAA